MQHLHVAAIILTLSIPMLYLVQILAKETWGRQEQDISFPRDKYQK